MAQYSKDVYNLAPGLGRAINDPREDEARAREASARADQELRLRRIAQAQQTALAQRNMALAEQAQSFEQALAAQARGGGGVPQGYNDPIRTEGGESTRRFYEQRADARAAAAAAKEFMNRTRGPVEFGTTDMVVDRRAISGLDGAHVRPSRVVPRGQEGLGPTVHTAQYAPGSLGGVQQAGWDREGKFLGDTTDPGVQMALRQIGLAETAQAEVSRSAQSRESLAGRAQSEVERSAQVGERQRDRALTEAEAARLSDDKLRAEVQALQAQVAGDTSKLNWATLDEDIRRAQRGEEFQERDFYRVEANDRVRNAVMERAQTLAETQAAKQYALSQAQLENVRNAMKFDQDLQLKNFSEAHRRALVSEGLATEAEKRAYEAMTASLKLQRDALTSEITGRRADEAFRQDQLAEQRAGRLDETAYRSDELAERRAARLADQSLAGRQLDQMYRKAQDDYALEKFRLALAERGQAYDVDAAMRAESRGYQQDADAWITAYKQQQEAALESVPDEMLKYPFLRRLQLGDVSGYEEAITDLRTLAQSKPALAHMIAQVIDSDPDAMTRVMNEASGPWESFFRDVAGTPGVPGGLWAVLNTPQQERAEALKKYMDVLATLRSGRAPTEQDAADAFRRYMATVGDVQNLPRTTPLPSPTSGRGMSDKGRFTYRLGEQR